MSRIGNQLLRESKAELLAARIEDGNENIHGKDSNRARDLLSLLLRANTATDLPHDQRMTDEDVLARKSFLFQHRTSQLTRR